MSIGRFSRLTGLTVKALRHYDELGLLRPAAVDPETGYRSYSSAQVGPGRVRSGTLRRLELPLDDIATLLATDDPGDGAPRARRPPAADGAPPAELNWILQGLQPLIDGKEPVMGTHAEALDRETAAAARRRLLQQDVDADGEAGPHARGGRRDGPLRARIGVPLATRSARPRTARAASGSARACTRSSAAPSRRCITRAAASSSSRPRPTEMEDWDLPGGLRGARAGALGRRRRGGGAPLRRARPRGDREDRRRGRPHG